MSSRLLYKYDCYQFSYRYTLEDIMAKVIGHFTMWIPTHRNQCFSWNLIFSLICVMYISGLVLPGCHAQNDTSVNSASSLQGICNIDQIPDPCVIGEKYGDPGDCTVYYECTSGTNALDLHYCETGSKYDYKKKKCRTDRPNLKRAIRCRPPCDEDKNNVQVAPFLKTEKPINKRSENATLEASQSITEPNEAGTTADDETIKAAGSLGKDNDTVVPAVVPNQGAGPSGADANTTAVNISDETEAQTEGEDVITTAPSSTTLPTTPPQTPSPTPPPTPSPSTKSTTKSTTTTQPGVVVVETDGDPGYDIVSTAPNNSSGSLGEVDESKDGVSTATIGIAVGIILAILIASVAVFLLICHIRKKKYSKEKQIVSIENPKYKQTGGDKHAYRFSRDASLLVNEKPANNNSTEKLAFIPGRKRPAPSTPSKDKSKDKRKAPPPPNPFTGEIEDEDFRPPTFRKDSTDLYERDTDGSAEEVELSTFSAPTSSFGTGTGTFGKGKNFGDTSRNKGTPNGRLQPQPSRSTDYSSEEADSDEEDDKLLGTKYKSTDIDDAVFKDDAKSKDVNNSMDAYLSAYDQALK